MTDTKNLTAPAHSEAAAPRKVAVVTGATGLLALLTLVALEIVLGVDKVLETRLVDASPDWLTRLTTRF